MGVEARGGLPSLDLTVTPPSLWLQVGKLRERLQEAKLEREQEQRRHTAYISELKAKLHEEKTKELQALREVLIRQHEQEAARTAKIKEGELQRLQATLNVLRDGAADKVKTALLAEAREEARRAFDGERLRLQQEVLELKATRKQAEEALAICMQADKAKAADLRAAYQAHQDEVHRIKRECERDIRRLVRASPQPRLAVQARGRCRVEAPAALGVAGRLSLLGVVLGGASNLEQFVQVYGGSEKGLRGGAADSHLQVRRGGGEQLCCGLVEETKLQKIRLTAVRDP